MDASNYALKSQVKTTKYSASGQLFEKRSAANGLIKTIPSGESIFYSVGDTESMYGAKGCEGELIEVWTVQGTHGYMDCRNVVDDAEY